MPTAAERQALLFIVAVALVGGSVRAIDAHRLSQTALPGQPGENVESVESQLAAVDSERSRTSSRGSRTSSRANTRRNSGRSVPRPRADTSMITRDWNSRDGNGPVRTSRDRNSRDRDRAPRRSDASGIAVAIDVDAASAEDLARLPHIGATLAQRIVDNRDSLGTFGSIEALTRVRGIGAALAKQLAPMVTFSGRPSPVHGELRKRFH